MTTANVLRKKPQRKAFIQHFIQSVCTPTTVGKRVKAIRRLFSVNFNWTRDDCGYIWKGLFYAVWYTEMGKGCEDLINEIANHIEASGSFNLIIAGFEAMEREWLGIDYIRIDKFMYLVRHLTNKAIKLHFKEGFRRLKRKSISEEEESDDLDGNGEAKGRKSTLDKENNLNLITSRIQNSCGLMCHFTEIFFEETSKILESQGYRLTLRQTPLIVSLLTPFMDVLAVNEDFRTQNSITECVFTHIEKELLGRASRKTQLAVLKSVIVKLIQVGGRKDIKAKNRGIIYGLVKKVKASIENVKESDEVPVKRKRKTLSDLTKAAIKRRKESSAVCVRSVIPLPVP